MHFVIARLVLTECWAMLVAVGIFVDGEVPGVVAPYQRAPGGVTHTYGGYLHTQALYAENQRPLNRHNPDANVSLGHTCNRFEGGTGVECRAVFIPSTT